MCAFVPGSRRCFDSCSFVFIGGFASLGRGVAYGVTRPTFQRFEEGDVAVDFGKAEVVVEVDAEGVLEFGVAGEFGVAAGRGPDLDGIKQQPADALSTKGFLDKPCFEVGDRGDGSAVDVVVAKGYFGESNHLGLSVLGEKDGAIGFEQLAHFQSVFVGWALRPKGLSEKQPRGFVSWLGQADSVRGGHAIKQEETKKTEGVSAFGRPIQLALSGVLIFIHSATCFQWTEGGDGRMTILAKAGVIRSDEFDSNQGDIGTFMLVEMLRSLLN